MILAELIKYNESRCSVGQQHIAINCKVCCHQGLYIHHIVALGFAVQMANAAPSSTASISKEVQERCRRGVSLSNNLLLQQPAYKGVSPAVVALLTCR